MDPRTLLLAVVAVLACAAGAHLGPLLLAVSAASIGCTTVGAAGLLALRCVSLHHQGCLVWGAS